MCTQMDHYKKRLTGVIQFSQSKYYKTWKPFLLEILKLSRSREIFNSPLRLFELQLNIVETISEIEKKIGIQKKEYNFNKTDPDLIYNQRLRQILKDIADGLAWKLLGYNRPAMRILSQNKSPGFLKNHISKEDDVAMGYVSAGNHVLIHDITNILRVGDLTVFDSNGNPNIYEVKRSGKKVWTADDYKRVLSKGGDLANQSKKILELSESLKSGIISINEENVILGQIDIPINTYLDKVGNVLNDCQKKGMCSVFIDRLLFIRAYRTDAQIETFDTPFKHTKYRYDFSSIETLYPEHGEIYRNKIPYSSFPFSDDIVLQLLSGEIILESNINLIKLSKKFNKNGWKVKNVSDKLIKDYLDNKHKNFYGESKLFPFSINTTMFVISKDDFKFELGTEHIGQIVIDFLKPEIIIETAKYLRALTEPTRSNDQFGIAYLKERDIWV